MTSIKRSALLVCLMVLAMLCIMLPTAAMATEGDADCSVTDVDKHVFTASAGANGSISPGIYVAVDHGSDKTFTIIPDSYYIVKDVKVDDISVFEELVVGEGNSKTYTFKNVTAAHTITAIFELSDKIEITLAENAESLDFGYMKLRSEQVPAAQIVTVTNISSSPVKLASINCGGEDGSYFTATPSWEPEAELAAWESVTFNVQVKPNITTAGTYTNTITVTTAGGVSASCTARVQACATLEASCGEHGRFECFGITTIDGIDYITGQNSYVEITIDRGYVFDTFQIMFYMEMAGRWYEGYTENYIGKLLPGGSARFGLSNMDTKYSATFRLGRFAITASVNGNGGAITPVDATATEEGVVTVDGLTNQAFLITADPGYYLKAVYVDNVAVDASDYAAGTYQFSEVIADHSIMAQFEGNNYTIAFDSNGGTGAMDSMTDLEYGTAEQLPANTFTRDEYSFAGWATEPTGAVIYNDEAEVDMATTLNNATMTFYAVWTGGPVQNRSVYTVTPAADAVYTIGATIDGIKTMTVNDGNNGLNYFTINISPVTAHSGDEATVFVHLRNDTQLELNASRADFDLVNTASAGFNVQVGDVVKVYLVDDLTNATDFNPRVLQ